MSWHLKVYWCLRIVRLDTESSLTCVVQMLKFPVLKSSFGCPTPIGKGHNPIFSDIRQYRMYHYSLPLPWTLFSKLELSDRLGRWQVNVTGEGGTRIDSERCSSACCPKCSWATNEWQVSPFLRNTMSIGSIWQDMGCQMSTRWGTVETTRDCGAGDPQTIHTDLW